MQPLQQKDKHDQLDGVRAPTYLGTDPTDTKPPLFLQKCRFPAKKLRAVVWLAALVSAGGVCGGDCRDQIRARRSCSGCSRCPIAINMVTWSRRKSSSSGVCMYRPHRPEPRAATGEVAGRFGGGIGHDSPVVAKCVLEEEMPLLRGTVVSV